MATVERLTKYVQQKYQEQADAERIRKQRGERDRIIDDAAPFAVTEFYCPRHGDFKADAYKVVQRDPTVQGQRIAFYRPIPSRRALFWNGGEPHWGVPCKQAIRRITDKQFDPYYRDSEQLAKERIDHADDFLQPGDPRFNQLYGDPLKPYYERMEAIERAKWEAQRKL
jgi:hypothetical protein